jgi:Ni,Fe-hydrogenase III large subunit/Ni,Fe-hydrogenase III component G
MGITRLDLGFERLPAPLPIRRACVDAAHWLAAAGSIAQSGGRLVALWGSDRSRGADAALAICAAYAAEGGLYWVDLGLAADAPHYPDLAQLFPYAGRMQRAVSDLLGLVADGAQDRRPWLNHGAWGADYLPLRQEHAARTAAPQPLQDYPFVRVEGDGVHEIPVGPVHAGIIEPGHFRFSVVGEKVLRLEQRLGYTHKGTEQRFLTLPALQGHRLAGRVSGDSTVAFAWAWCMALESALGCEVPQRAQWLRALMLERERVAAHLNDLGFLGNDAALGFGLAQFSRLREDWLRLSGDAFGHRLMMDRVVPGGVAADLDEAMRQRIGRQCDALEPEVRALEAIYESHAGLQDRFATTGIATPALAQQLGLTGLAGRASGQGADLRCDQPWAPYAGLQVRRALHRNGDVAARVAVRFQEVFESLRLVRALCDGLPAGPACLPPQAPTGAAFGAGWVEGWRGEVFVALELGPGGAVQGCHCHDPSRQYWPVLEHAVIGNIVPDFPLINKSFNLSYSGHDL